jgi:hypothetical protein
VASSQERVDTHGASSQDDPARTPPLLELPESMHKANRYGIETTTLRRLLPVDAHSARPFTWNNDSEVCRTQATRHLSAVLLSGRHGPRRCPLGSNDSEGCRIQATRHLSAVLLSGQPGPRRCPLGSVTDLLSTAQ